MSLFTREEEERISAAIMAAERKTSGEIVAVITDSSETYLYVPFLWAALLSLLAPWPLIHFTWMKVQYIFLIQLVVFLVLLVLLWPKHVRAALVPRSVRNLHAKRRATEQFLVQNLHTTKGRTGVLIFVSVAERHAEVLADKAIDDKVPGGTWQEIVDSLTSEISQGRAADGFITAIKAAGEHLARHFPPGASDPNELPDHLIVLGG
ncbi:MAG TPA: TPM domain-containing protein [Hyphomicrobium sp.]|nr:TPM domain-containing protein [Hyphomicrobium sp.]